MSGWKGATPTVAPTQTFDYKQASDNRWGIKKISSSGACQGLSIFWVIKKANNIDYITWLGPPPAASSQGHNPPNMGSEMDAVIRVMEQQDKIFKLPQGNRSLNMKWAKERISQFDTSGGGSTSLHPQGNLVLLQGASPKQIASEVTSVDGFAFIGFSVTGTAQVKGWGHAVAARVQGQAVDFFDPNYGEYHFQDLGSFHTWFEHSLIKPGYGVSNLDTAEIQHFT
jgi:hypothetical protein